MNKDVDRILPKEHHEWLSRNHLRQVKKYYGSMFGGMFVLLFALIGFSFAHSSLSGAERIRPYAGLEPELGTIAGPAEAKDDTTAAGRKFILFKAPPPTTPPPTTPPPTTPPPTTPPPSSKVRRFPGDPNPKLYHKAYWGAAIDSNGSPARHESPTGKSLSIRRTFFSWDQATNLSSVMYQTISADVNANRLPFVSIKTPDWASVGNGSYDAQLDSILKKINSYGKPVWFTAHHEPEGGGSNGNIPDDPGGAPAWRAMQTRIRQRMTATGVKNIAFMPVLMSYSWNPASGRNPNDWWVAGIWDAYIVDHYRDNESGDMFTSNQWTSFAAWAESRGMPYGTGEWGNRGTDANAGNEMQAYWDWSFNNNKDVIAYTYFDSGLNSPNGTWVMAGSPLTKFQSIMKSDAKVQRINDL